MLADLFDFLDRGGPVLVVIMGATFIMWVLILERLFYFNFGHAQVAKSTIDEWKCLAGPQVHLGPLGPRQACVGSPAESRAKRISTKAMVALAPLLGLLGTVTGMVTVFDVMALHRVPTQAMSGVSATIPTMRHGCFTLRHHFHLKHGPYGLRR